MPLAFDGPKRRQDAINNLRASLPENPPPVWIILFTASSDARFEVARVSADEKVKVFKAAGVPVELVTDKNWCSFASTKQALLSSSTLKIVQQPLPKAISNLPIKSNFDMYAANGSVGLQYAKQFI